jgi:4-hydroxy-L-threonine phosphate dehydrogenase PdxA
MPEEINKTVGSLNGWQVWLFRLNLVVLPVLLSAVLTMAGFLVNSQISIESRLTVIESQNAMMVTKDALAVALLTQHISIMSEVAKKYPTNELIKDVEENRRDIRTLLNSMRVRLPEFREVESIESIKDE